jgi:hypothetical protein
MSEKRAEKLLRRAKRKAKKVEGVVSRRAKHASRTTVSLRLLQT